MRAIRGAAPGASIAEMWVALRDDPGVTPNYGDQVAAFNAGQDYCAPSKAHVKRILRDRSEAFAAPQRVARVVTPREAFMRDQTGKLSQMGATPRWSPPEPVQREVVVRGTPTPLTPQMRSQRFSQRIAECNRLLNLARTMPSGPARTDVLRRATDAARTA